MLISWRHVPKLVLRLTVTIFVLSYAYRLLPRRAPAARGAGGGGAERAGEPGRLSQMEALLPPSVLQLRRQGEPQARTENNRRVVPVLVMACDRVTVRRCLDKLVQYRPDVDTFPIIVSQDCGHNQTNEAILGVVKARAGVSVVRQRDQSRIPLSRSSEVDRAYFNIARHYKFALSHVLEDMAYEYVIIVEDDLDVAKDFYEYFSATLPLLEKDHSLWCISAWNDNGMKDHIDASKPELLHRTDFFPGLGWLLPARVWRQLKPDWPKAYFDDWLRVPSHVEHRSCIRPEISRTKTFGQEGVSNGRYFDSHLRHIQLSDRYVPFTKLNLSYLLKDAYNKLLSERVADATALSVRQAARGAGDPQRPAKVLYSSCVLLRKGLRALRLMDDVWFGVPRTAYRGVVSCFYGGRRVYIAPRTSFTKYNPLCA